MVEYITYQGKAYPIRISYFALKMLKTKLGRSLSVTDDGTDYEAYETLLYYALLKGHAITNQAVEFPFKEEDMEDVMDECFFEFLNFIPKFFPKTETEIPVPTDIPQKTEGSGGRKK